MVSPEKVTMEYFLLGCLPHPSSFIKRTLFDAHSYDERFKIAGDWEFFMYHLIARNVTYHHININVTLFDTTGISSSTKSDMHDTVFRQEAINRIILPRVADDYDKFMGKQDEYHRLFYVLEHTKYKRFFYVLSLFSLKMVTLNRGWVKDFHL